MSKPFILIIGPIISSQREYLETNDFDYISLRDKTRSKDPEKKLKHRVVCDFSSQAEILATIDDIRSQHKIDGVITTYEQYISVAAMAAHHLGLPALPFDAAKACTDKELMRSLMSKAPQKISPDFAHITNEQDLLDFAHNHSFPLIIKPANLSKSLLVSKSDSMDELLDNFEKTLQNIDAVYAKYAPHTTPKLLVEEFMEGPIHSVDAFVDATGKPHMLDAIVDYQTGHDIGYNDNFHYSRLLPSKLSASDQSALRQAAELGIEALGMKNSPAHVEIIMTNSGPRIVEIGARNGGYRERMHSRANGLDIFGNALRISMGKPLKLTSDRNEPVGVFELFPKKPGIFVELASEDKLKQLPSLEYLSIKAKPGDFVGSSSAGHKMCAVVILHNKDAAQFDHDVEFLNNSVHVVTAE